jgi:hypothetical protein
MRKALPFLLAALVSPILAGCPPLDAIEGKSSREAYEHRQSILMQAPTVPAALVAPDPPTIVTNPNDPWPLEVDTAPDCVPVLRVTTCDE